MSIKERKLLQRFKKSCMVALLAAGMLMGAAGGAKAIEFKAQGEWLMGFGVADAPLASHARTPQGGYAKEKVNDNDMFGAAQRLRLQLDAVASENLSGTVFFEIGTQNWGKADEGGALGADGSNVIKLKNAYLDWIIPQTDARVRMGIQGLALPDMAGGSAVLDGDVAAIVGNYKFNENVGLTAFWARPVNDNFDAGKYGNGDHKAKNNYLDNIDLFAITVPVTFDGVEVTPWAMYGMLGRNALRGLSEINDNEPWETSDGILGQSLPGLTEGFNFAGATPLDTRATSKQYGNMFWVGLPIGITMFDPLNIEFDINYGYVESMGRYDVVKRGNDSDVVRGSTERQGFVAKALVEYKMDWATPGIFGWYGSGDDGDIKNGSKRMPSIAGAGNFTSFVGDGNLAWGAGPGDICDWNMTYAGTWGIGGQLKDMSFMEDLKHTLRVAYWGGTNAPSMVKYMESASSWNSGFGVDGPYLTTNDGLLEFNLINQWQIYENLEANFELGYVVNMIDKDTWKKDGYYSGSGNGSFEKQDAWKAQLVFAYSF